MTVSLPGNPDLTKLKGHARTLRDQVRDGVPTALELVRTHHPRRPDLTADDAVGFRLADAQLTLARRYGFASWPRLVSHLRVTAELRCSPHAEPVGLELHDDAERADELLRLACLTYGSDDRTRLPRAQALLAEHPQLAAASIHTAAATGQHAVVAAMLDAEPGLVEVRGGPFRWEPLLYLTYSRLRDGDPPATARALLAAGADPDAGFLWDGLVPPFTALAGVFGAGEGDAPPHVAWPELARLLLAAGADANDAQTLYNWGLGGRRGDDTAVLELLYEFGFGRGDGGPWKQRLGDAHPTPTQLVADELAHAARSGLPRRTRLLLAHGADPNSRGGHPVFGGRTAYQLAVGRGHTEVAELLGAAGADLSSVSEGAVLVGRLLQGDRTVGSPAVKRIRKLHPGLIVTVAELGRAQSVQLLVELGWDVNHRRRTTALHEAAIRGDRELTELLLGLGADRGALDTEHNATPAGWARFHGHDDLALLLEP